MITQEDPELKAVPSDFFDESFRLKKSFFQIVTNE